ncbi:MAG: outer membrane lipoprotein carrier protein LolA [Odoribacter sp.]
MRYFTTILLTLMTFAVLAQSDPKAKAILDKAATKFKAYSAAEIDFTFSMENPAENINESHKGKAWMKGNLYKLNLMDVENYYDGKNLYTYMPEVKEVNIKNPSSEEGEMLNNPASLFDIYQKGFDQKLISTTNGIAYIELMPTVKKNFTKVGIWVNVATSSIQKVTSFGKDGNNIVISIQSIKPLTPTPADSFFQFDTVKHPDVEVVDMR